VTEGGLRVTGDFGQEYHCIRHLLLLLEGTLDIGEDLWGGLRLATAFSVPLVDAARVRLPKTSQGRAAVG
jgi:hypothetical protein